MRITPLRSFSETLRSRCRAARRRCSTISRQDNDVGRTVGRVPKKRRLFNENNDATRMGTSRRTAGPTRGWMGAHAPITTVFVPETEASGEMMRLSSFDPIAALGAARPLVATGGERVQGLQTAELAADFQPSAIAIRSSSRYYEDGGDALRFEKRLVPNLRALAVAPPYFHQTTEFTCGPACIMMAQGRDLDAAAQVVHRVVRAVAARREWLLHD
jgi:Peptidase_C39 like family